MTELKLGNKYECFNCGAKFYDMGKGEPVCPKCGADQKDAEEKENPLVTQSVKRERKTELLPDEPEDGDVPVGEDLDDEDLDDEDLDLDLDDEDLELDEADLDDEDEDDDD